jgi:hypothetical protein
VRAAAITLVAVPHAATAQQQARDLASWLLKYSR